MKKVRKIMMLLAAMLVASVLVGCGSFDASGYIKALLDNSYKNDSAAFVEQKVGTKEQAENLYKQGIETALKSLTSQASLSDELQKEFEEVVKDVYKNVKYTVGESTKNDDGSYNVEVKYQKMNVFAPAMENYNTAYQAYLEEMTKKAEEGGETPSEDEINEAVFAMLKDAIKESIGNAEFSDEETTSIQVQLVNKVYTPKEDDVYNLERALFDIDAVAAEEE